MLDLRLKEGLVECATVCAKSEVMLILVRLDNQRTWIVDMYVSPKNKTICFYLHLSYPLLSLAGEELTIKQKSSII